MLELLLIYQLSIASKNALRSEIAVSRPILSSEFSSSITAWQRSISSVKLSHLSLLYLP